MLRTGSVWDTSCMKALRCVKSFEGFLAPFFSRGWAWRHTSTRAAEVLLLNRVGGDGREFSFHL